MALPTRNNIVENQLVYSRKKTDKLIKLPIHPNAWKLINKFHNPRNPYLFPILSIHHKTEQQKANRVHKVIAKTNKDLNNIEERLKFPILMTTYVACHSFATVLKRSGIKTSMISELLEHSSEKVMQIYLASFENTQLNKAMECLL